MDRCRKRGRKGVLCADRCRCSLLLVLILNSRVGSAASKPIIGGQGNWTFLYMPGRVIMPPGACTSDACNCHGLEVDASTKDIFLTYEPDHNSSDSHCMVRFKPDGTDGIVFGPSEQLCAGTPHGLRIVTEGGQQYLYHANNQEALHKTRLDGSLVWSSFGPPDNRSAFEPYRPTWFAAPPGSKFIYLADGYGSNLIHVYTITGQYTGQSYGGPEMFSTCHAINYDPRFGQLVVSDRENHRHQYFTFDPTSPDEFEYASQFSIPQLQRPCHIRVGPDGLHAVIPALEGPVGIVDHNNKLVSLIDVAALLGDQGHLHPHDAILLPSGDLVVATWNPGRLSYWKRIPPHNVGTKADKDMHVVE